MFSFLVVFACGGFALYYAYMTSKSVFAAKTVRKEQAEREAAAHGQEPVAEQTQAIAPEQAQDGEKTPTDADEQ